MTDSAAVRYYCVSPDCDTYKQQVVLASAYDALLAQGEALEQRTGCWHGEKGHPCLLDKVAQLAQQLAEAQARVKELEEQLARIRRGGI